LAQWADRRSAFADEPFSRDGVRIPGGAGDSLFRGREASPAVSTDFGLIFAGIAILLAGMWAAWRIAEPLVRIGAALEALVELLRGDAAPAERLRSEAAKAPDLDKVEWQQARTNAGLGPRA
jgi:hypothetical protein